MIRERDSTQGKKARIHSKAFAAIAGTEAVAKAKAWLVENGFLKISDDYSSGRRSKEYQLLRSGKLVQTRTQEEIRSGVARTGHGG